MKILVTGATGGLGLQIIEDWCQKKDRSLLALGRKTERLAPFEKKIAIQKCSLSDTEALSSACAGQDTVIHCAALSSNWGSYEEFYEANVQGTKNILEASVLAQVKRFILISSPSVYISNKNRLNIRESDPLPTVFINHYAATKKMSEDLALWYHQRGLPVIILRPQAILGLHDQVLLPRFLKLAKKGIFPIFGDGENQMDLTSAKNVVDAIEKACFAPLEATGEIYNITNGEPVKLYPALKSFIEALGFKTKDVRIPYSVAMTIAMGFESFYKAFRGSEPPITQFTVCALGLSRTLNIEKSKLKLGYEPQIPLQQTLSEIVSHHKGLSK